MLTADHLNVAGPPFPVNSGPLLVEKLRIRCVCVKLVIFWTYGTKQIKKNFNLPFYEYIKQTLNVYSHT